MLCADPTMGESERMPPSAPDPAALVEENRRLRDELRDAQRKLSRQAFEIENLLDASRELASCSGEPAALRLSVTAFMAHFLVSRCALYLDSPAGLRLADGELPDYLPALLEFAALAPDGEGAALLAELRAPLELVRARLHERESPWAHLLDALAAALPPLTRAQAERARRLAEEGPPTELVGLDSPPVPEPEPVG